MATTRFADHLTKGVFASRPAASAVPEGSLYSATDTGIVYQSDGVSSWAVYTNPGLPVTIIDAKGDLIAGTAADTAARVAVGANDTVLTADSSATAGVKWATPAGGGGGALTQISDSTLGASAASFDLTSIAGTYNHLRLVLLSRTDRANAGDTVGLRFNNDSGSNYSTEQLTANGTSTSAAENVAVTRALAGITTGASATSGRFGVTIFDIPCYAQTTAFKAFLSESVAILGGAGTMRRDSFGSEWASTAAITRITVFPITGPNFIAGSRATLYGVT